MRPELFFIKDLWQNLLPDLPPLSRKEAGSLFKRSGYNVYASVWVIWRLSERTRTVGPVRCHLAWLYGLVTRYTDADFINIPQNLLPEVEEVAA